MDLHYVTMTNYDDTFRNVHVIYDKDNLAMTLGEAVANAGLKQIRIAETEKYPARYVLLFPAVVKHPLKASNASWSLLRKSPPSTRDECRRGYA